MLGHPTTRRAAIMAAMGTMLAVRNARTAPPPATVVGTAAARLFRCNPQTCALQLASASLAPLGTHVELVDGALAAEQASGQFVRVKTPEVEGYAQDWYLKEDDHPAPFLRQGDQGCQRLALIFNIGVGFAPDLGILDTLAATSTPATMFVMGWWADRHPAALEALRRMVEAGYSIGSHGYDAVELPELDDSAVADDVQASLAAIERAINRSPSPLFTPYAAAMDERVRSIVANLGLLPVAWTVSGADYGPDVTEHDVFDHVIADVHDGALIELHLVRPCRG